MDTASEPLIPRFQKSGLWILTVDHPLIGTLNYMAENDFSQVIVKRDGRLTLLTVEGILRWLTLRIKDSRVNLECVTVGDVLMHEPTSSSILLSSTATIKEAATRIADTVSANEPGLYAIIITKTGKHSEPPLGIVGPWDLLKYGVQEDLADTK